MQPAIKVIVSSDKPYAVANFIVNELASRGYKVLVDGALKDGKPVPWPDAAYSATKRLVNGEADTAVLICFTGTGITIAANKVKGVRAALCLDPETARLARLLNNANVLTLSARLITEYLAKEILDAWLSVKEPDYSRADRFKRLEEIEETEFK